MHARGRGGELRVGYQRAALLGDWTLSSNPERPLQYELDASVSSTDEFWITQSPLKLKLDLGSFSWLWSATASVCRESGKVSCSVKGRPVIVRR